MKPLAAVLAIALAPVLPARADAPPSVAAEAPRAYGYQVGDLVQRRLVVFVPDGWRVDEASLPRVGGRGQAIELRRVGRQQRAAAGGNEVVFDLEYQVMQSPPAVRVYEIAPTTIRFEHAQRREERRVEAAPVTVAPLVPAEAPSRRGLGPLQPDREPPLVDTGRWRARLALWAVLAAGCGLWLAWLHVGPWWRAARARPFGQAWRQLRRLPPQASGAEWRAACRRLHAALDRSAGEVVFEAGLERWLAAAPRFAALRGELGRFLALSRREFFADGRHEAGDAAWLVGLARRLRDAERGGA